MARRPIADLHPDYLKSRLTVELFPCHANANKHTVKFFLDAVRGHLGTKVWLDERELIVGDVLAEKLQPVVGRGGQFVVPFISVLSVDSEWVRDELRWAFEKEEIQKRTIVLPVVVDERGDHVIGMLRERWPDDLVSKITERVYLQLNDYSDDETASRPSRWQMTSSGGLHSEVTPAAKLLIRSGISSGRPIEIPIFILARLDGAAGQRANHAVRSPKATPCR